MSSINVVSPSTMWVEKRNYRVLTPSTTVTQSYMEDFSYLDDSTYKDDLECEIEVDIPIEKLANGKMMSSFPVASSYLSYLIGVKGATKRRIENDTQTQIKVPAKGQIADVVVTGKDVKSVRQARIKLELLVDQVKRKQPFTHFISIPCKDILVQDSFLQFKSDVLNVCGGSQGIVDAVFQDPKKLHLTICVMVLADERERSEAATVLKNCQKELMEEYVKGETMKIELKGIEIMNDDPGEVSILYAKVITSSWIHSLQNMADFIASRVIKAGIAYKQYDQVKLHVTLMNTKFLKENDDSSKTQEKVTFDARMILEEFRDFSFGVIEVSELHLSIRHSKSESGYYSATCVIPLT